MRTAEGHPERGLERVPLQVAGLAAQFLHGIHVGRQELAHLCRRRQALDVVQPQFAQIILIKGPAVGQPGHLAVRQPDIEGVSHVAAVAGVLVGAALRHGQCGVMRVVAGDVDDVVGLGHVHHRRRHLALRSVDTRGARSRGWGRTGLELLHRGLHVLFERTALLGSRKRRFRVTLLLGLAREDDIAIEAHDLEAAVLAAQHRHESVTAEFGRGALLVAGNALRARAVRLDDRDFEVQLLLHGDVGVHGGAGQQHNEGDRNVAGVHVGSPLDYIQLAARISRIG